MLSINTTDRGLGIECWGTHDDLDQLYDFIGNFWGDELLDGMEGGMSRNKLLSWLSYDIRKAFQGGRLYKEKSTWAEALKTPYFGLRISWPHILYSLAALEFNMQYKQPSKLDMGLLLQFKYLLEEAMKAHDPVTAMKLLPFITDISRDNKYIYHFCRRADIDYFKMARGKKNFSKLPLIMEPGLRYSQLFSARYDEMVTAELEFGDQFDRYDYNEQASIYEVVW